MLGAPWLLLPAAWGLITLRKDLRTFAPEWLLFLLPLVVVAVFFYSPRYRVIALPPAAVTPDLKMTMGFVAESSSAVRMKRLPSSMLSK